MHIKKFENYSVLDESLNNSFFSGNKFRKIKGILASAKYNSIKGILSFGSPYSSNLLACAWYAKKLRIPFQGIVLKDNIINTTKFPNLKMVENLGGKLIYSKLENAYATIEDYKIQLNDYLWVPGGAHNLEAAKEYEAYFDRLFLCEYLNDEIDNIIVPYGTGTTAYGIWKSIINNQKKITVYGVSVSRKQDKCFSSIKELEEVDKFPGLIIDDRFSGSYDKIDDKTNNYRWRFFSETGILPDPIYNAKAVNFYYESDLSNTLIVNTGGMLNNLL